MSKSDIELKIKRAKDFRKKLDEIKGDHELFVSIATDCLRSIQSAIEYMDPSVGGHGGSTPNDPLIRWLFDKATKDRHEGLPRQQHADQSVQRVPDGFPYSTDRFFEIYEEDHLYFFEDPPDDLEKEPVTGIIDLLINELEIAFDAYRHESDNDSDGLISN